jgi:hypothetical protein
MRVGGERLERSLAERGYEQGAEIMAWTLGTRILTAQIPCNDLGSIEEAYELLTGISTPEQ